MRCIKVKVTQSLLPNLNSVVAWYRVIRNDVVASYSTYSSFNDSFTGLHAKVCRDSILLDRTREEALTVT